MPLIAALLLALAGCSDAGPSGQAGDAQAVNPYPERGGYADPGSHTAQAAGHDPVFARLAAIPQGIWLTPEEHPAGEVGPYVAAIVEQADEAQQGPTCVVYGIPDRDCSGGYSSGGLSVGDYAPWVQEIADAAGGGGSAVAILEPDALAAAVECERQAERVQLIGDAVATLREAGVTTYVDGGHSRWVDPARIADLLDRVGVRDVRGFATNVANFQTDRDEQAYAERLSGLLGGAHYVIDSGRNGVGASDEWCNPPARAFGTEPVAAGDNDPEHQDAYLWIKPPGESDGECGGGPPAGSFWPERALAMADTSGW